MASIVAELHKKGLIKSAPPYLSGGMQYEVIMGSMAYGVSTDVSDMDVYGFCIPLRDYVFPHLRGEIEGFSTPGPRFEQFQMHHIMDNTALGGKGREYDLAIYSIIKYFRLCMENNPNMIDSLFVPQRCVLFATDIGDMVRESRRLFLHKGAWHKFKGYAFAQMRKLKTKQPQGKRKGMIEEFGYDVKFAYHVVRLLDEVEQIMTEGDIDLERNREQLKSIRDGDWSIDRIEQHFADKEKSLESLYTSCHLPYKPDEGKIQTLLLQCLEQYYGDLSSCVVDQDAALKALREISRIAGSFT
ncbi:MAG: nucleotidyltransferase domain-containing protein [Gammaproteobacteria bacterium]|nr:nucleotidyltransferase domain-containing protein [Gammaproteobacteria bacterium]MDH5652006.1 nucleotidyltransferase domain-containing protein [Gammaproteobacteria bacterium]